MLELYFKKVFGFASSKIDWRHFLFFAAVGAVVWKAPYLLIDARFWAEEGTQFCSVGTCESAIASLFYLGKHTGGYLNFVPNLVITITANLAPINWWPYVTTYIAFFIQLVPFAIVIYGNSKIWNNLLTKTVACLAIILMGFHGEIWLNTANSQVHCGVIAVVILAEDLSRARKTRTAIYALLLGICGLTGIYTAVLAPAFVLKYVFDKNKSSKIVSMVVCLSLLIQGLIFLNLYLSHNISAKKLNKVTSSTLILRGLSYHFVKPVFNKSGERIIFKHLKKQKENTVLLCCYILLLLGSLGFLIIGKNSYPTVIPMLIAYITIAVITTLFSAGNIPGGRYMIVSNVTLTLLLLAGTVNPSTMKWPCWICALLLCLALKSNVSTYLKDEKRLIRPTEYPNWQQAVESWNQGQHSTLPVWPKGWGCSPCKN